MKCLFIAVILLFIGSPSFGQANLAAGLSFGTDVSELGIFVRGGYQFAPAWRGQGTFNYYFTTGNELSLWNIDLEGNYFFWENEKFRTYALAGLTFARVGVDIDSPVPGVDLDNSSTDVGLLLGAGGEFVVSETVRPFLEIKYDLGGFDQLALYGGVSYFFAPY